MNLVESGILKTGILLGALTALMLGIGWLLAGGTGAFVALVIAAAMNAYAFWKSDGIALRWHKARVVTRASAPELFRAVEDLSQKAGLPVPMVHVIDSDQPNAFATGRSPGNASIAVSTGLMRTLDRQELSGVLAHEMAHIKNRDTLIMTVAATIAGAIAMVAQYAIYFRGRGNAAGIIGALVAMFLAPIAAGLIQMLISRTREYEADRLGGEICGHPLWLAGALARISGGGQSVEMESAESHPASAHLFIINPLSDRGFDSLFSTHPRTENRIAALKRQAAEMDRLGRVVDGPLPRGRRDMPVAGH